jgi:phospholipid/cholesterol/gamma-HCH transport system substrate-binding protein
MDFDRDKSRHEKWWTLASLAFLVALVATVGVFFSGTFTPYVPATLASDRAGLVMEPGAKVKLRGVQVGRVSEIDSTSQAVKLRLDIDPDQIRYIPANIGGQIRATTAFGAKYVDLIYPSDPSPQRLQAGAQIETHNVSTEVNTVFQNLTSILKQIDPAKLNAVLSALGEGLRGEGPTIGQAITDANQVLPALNSRSDAVRRGWRSLKGVSDTYSAAAENIVAVLDAASTTSATITSNAQNLDKLLLSVIGVAQSGIDLLAPSSADLVTSVNALAPTTSLLLKYNPELTCMLVGGKWVLDNGGYQAGGGDGRTFVGDAAILLGSDPYRYPQNLPINGGKGGPDGKPGCGSLPDTSKSYPSRYVVTNTGWGTGLDVRPNPGIGFPGFADYFPVTRAQPEPPSVRNPGGPAPGPIPYPGAPPYGATLYAPDGTPLWPGLPPAPVFTSPPPDPSHVLPGAEPFVPPYPAQVVPTPLPPPPDSAGSATPQP